MSTAICLNWEFNRIKVGNLHVAKCNLGKVNLEAMLVSSFPSYTRGGLMPLAGVPHDLYTQLLACVLLQALAVCMPVRALVFPIPPSLLRFGLGKYLVG